ncbi:MAG: endolytic transglycosylase MltG [Chitinophagaceae bacterium]|nr:endolytic transglycosylase MltG [Bacteroidota bacterium]MCC6256882.1 endolytic transglycosylase MltG [Chitinophagaceae bacterium]MCW5916500.1 endolytic transglycosylase MltG [Ferruginibacter sp.]
MKKGLFILLFLIALVGAYSAWQVFGPTIHPTQSGFFYIKTGENFQQVSAHLKEQHIINSSFFFNQISKRAGYPEQIKPGKYAINKRMNLYSLVKMLKAGRQEPVRLVITKLRTKEDLAGKLGKLFESDSTRFINFLLNNDSIARYHLDTNTVMTMIIPNTYLFWWNSSVDNIFDRLHRQHDLFWEGSRSEKAASEGLSPEQVYTLASIVEEETNKAEDKGLIASVYMNRIKKGMRLEADPTVKYAMRDFGLKRIRHGHLDYPSPYNTYRNSGLPPGPICTPSINTLDAVLEAPKTDYLFFVAKPSLDGYSNFTSSYTEHLKFAKAYQKALDSIIIARTQNGTPQN